MSNSASNPPQKRSSATKPIPGTKDSLLSLIEATLKESEGTSTLFRRKNQFPTGIDTVDKVLNGGVHGITIIAGRPGVGKTAFLSQVAVKAVQNRDDNAVVIYSLDMSKTEFAQRLLIAATAVAEPEIEIHPENDIVPSFSRRAMSRILLKNKFTGSITRELTLEEKKRCFAYDSIDLGSQTYTLKGKRQIGGGEYPTLKGTVFTEVTLPTELFDGSSMVSDCEHLSKQAGIRNLMVIIDLFQDIRCDGGGTTRSDDQILEHLQENESHLQKLFPKGNVSILISSAVRKEPNSKGRQTSNIGMDDVIGSTNLGYSADVVLGLNFNKEVGDGENKVVLEVLKGRDGVTRGPIDLRYQYKTGQFLPASQAGSRKKKKGVKKRRDDLKD